VVLQKYKKILLRTFPDVFSTILLYELQNFTGPNAPARAKKKIILIIYITLCVGQLPTITYEGK